MILNFPKLCPKKLQFSMLYGLGITHHSALQFVGSYNTGAEPEILLDNLE
jgi:hypothetical protein